MNDKRHTKETRMQRRQFLANLLFAGGALTLAGLQGAQAAEHPTDGWTLPELGQTDPVRLPRRLLNLNLNRFRPESAPPVVMGRFVTPRGDVAPTCPPPKPGERVAPQPPEKK